MYQFVAASIGFGAGAFASSGDPLIGFLLLVCAIVWIAITTARVPFWAKTPHRPTFVVHSE